MKSVLNRLKKKTREIDVLEGRMRRERGLDAGKYWRWWKPPSLEAVSAQGNDVRTRLIRKEPTSNGVR